VSSVGRERIDSESPHSRLARAMVSAKWSGSLSVFYNDYNNLRSTSAAPTTAYYIFPYPVIFENNLEGVTRTRGHRAQRLWQGHLEVLRWE
jgi:hypothetical protein